MEDLEIPTTVIHNFSRYTIDINGNIYSKIRKRFIKTRVTDRYKQCNLINDDKKRKTISVHRLVALTFIPNPNNLPVIDHIDRNKLNNNVKNLRWTTVYENCANQSISKNNKVGYKNISICTRCFRIEIVRNHNYLFLKKYSKNKYTIEEIVKICNEKYREFNIEVTD